MKNSIEMVLHKSKILKYLTKEFPEVPVTVYKNYIKVPGVQVPKKYLKNLRITLRVPGVPGDYYKDFLPIRYQHNKYCFDDTHRCTNNILFNNFY